MLKTGQDATFFQHCKIANSKICSKHFTESDFHCSLNSGLKRFLKKDAVPSVLLPIPIGSIKFKQENGSMSDPIDEEKKSLYYLKDDQQFVDAKLIDANKFHEEMVKTGLKITKPIICNHRFSVEILREIKMTNSQNVFKHYTGFASYEKFMVFLNFILPGLTVLAIRVLLCNYKAFEGFLQ